MRLLYTKPVFWTGAYFVASCGGVTVDQVKKYVENQARSQINCSVVTHPTSCLSEAPKLVGGEIPSSPAIPLTVNRLGGLVWREYPAVQMERYPYQLIEAVWMSWGTLK